MGHIYLCACAKNKSFPSYRRAQETSCITNTSRYLTEVKGEKDIKGLAYVFTSSLNNY